MRTGRPKEIITLEEKFWSFVTKKEQMIVGIGKVTILNKVMVECITILLKNQRHTDCHIL